eukprot:5906883-Pleurochrysis_carterae.AAC.2
MTATATATASTLTSAHATAASPARSARLTAAAVATVSVAPTTSACVTLGGALSTAHVNGRARRQMSLALGVWGLGRTAAPRASTARALTASAAAGLDLKERRAQKSQRARGRTLTRSLGSTWPHPAAPIGSLST